MNPKHIVAAVVMLVTFSLPLAADTPAEARARIADLLSRLESAEPAEAHKIERELQLEWSKSGSAAMNLLLKRGQEALERGEVDLAIEHLSALTDHAPEFAEGWILRARAWHDKEELGMALADLQRALALEPNQFEALFGLAVVLEQLDHRDLALRAYLLVQTLHPHYEEAAAAIARLQPLVLGREL